MVRRCLHGGAATGARHAGHRGVARSGDPQGVHRLRDPFASIAPLFVLAGGFTHDGLRVALWIVAGLVNVVSAIRGASGEWAINPVHFAERHNLFVIISPRRGVGGHRRHGLRHRSDAARLVGLVAATVGRMRAVVGVLRIHPRLSPSTSSSTPAPRNVDGSPATCSRSATSPSSRASSPTRSWSSTWSPTRPQSLPVSDRWMLIASLRHADRRMPAHPVAGRAPAGSRAVRRRRPDRGVASDRGGPAGVSASSAWSPSILAVMQSITWRRYRFGLPVSARHPTAATGRRRSSMTRR